MIIIIMDEKSGASKDLTDRKHFELVLQASELLSSSPDIGDILNRLMDQVIDVIKARRGFILMKEDEGLKFYTARHIDEGEIDSEDFRISRSVVDQVALEGKSVVTSDALHDKRFTGRTSVSLFGLKSIICVPLIVHGKVTGVIYADHQIETCVFGKKEKALLESIARQAAIAIENARLYEKLKVVYEESMERARSELKETQALLFQSSKMAAVGQLAAGIAHEINNPLGAVELTISSMKKQLTDEKFKMRIETVENAIQQCKAIVKKLLHFSYPTDDILEKVDVRKLIVDGIALIEHQLEKDHIILKKSVEEGFFILANEGELSQVLMNILINARDALYAASTREREISVRCFSGGGAGNIEISDNGTGMSGEVRERIFEPFFTTKKVGEGVGLGLSICFQIVKKYNGEIKVKSEQGRGTVFTLEFPLPAQE